MVNRVSKWFRYSDLMTKVFVLLGIVFVIVWAVCMYYVLPESWKTYFTKPVTVTVADLWYAVMVIADMGPKIKD